MSSVYHLIDHFVGDRLKYTPRLQSKERRQTNETLAHLEREDKQTYHSELYGMAFNSIIGMVKYSIKRQQIWLN